MSDQTTTTAYPYDYNACAQRLPCGICRLTNNQCPKIVWPCTGTRYRFNNSSIVPIMSENVVLSFTVPYSGYWDIPATDITCNTTEGKVNE